MFYNAEHTKKLSLRCGCPVDTTAKQKHRPSRQARPPLSARQSVLHTPFVIASTERCAAIRFSFKRELRILSRFALRMTNRLVIATIIKCAINCRPVIAVRVSGGHHCEAEAPTEPTGETAVRRAAIRSLAPFVIAGTERCAAIRFSFKGELRILSRFALRMTNRLVLQPI